MLVKLETFNINSKAKIDAKIIFYLILSLLEVKTMLNIAMIMPIRNIIKPLSVHSLFPYINEEDGPIIEMLCNMNIIPIAINMIPKTIRLFPYFLISKCNTMKI